MLDAQELKELKVPKWPFFLADAFMLGLAYFIYWQGKMPLSQWEVAALGICVGLGALLGVLPYLLEYRAVIKYGALIKLIETSSLCAATEKIQNLENCVAHISTATDQLQTAQTQADKTAGLAQEITERMSAEVRDFMEFMQKANDGEKGTLRLEVEKLRRVEGEWLGVAVHILDHIFALNRAAERSGQQNLILQLGQFQAACRDSARRVGLAPVLAEAGEAFDAERHQLAEGENAGEQAVVAEVLATGYSFQGKIIRPVVVRLESAGLVAESKTSSASAIAQPHLPLGATSSPAA